MRRHRRHSIELKREMVQTHLDGKCLHGLAIQHGVNSNPIRGWVRKYESGEFDPEAVAAETPHAYRAKGAQVERKVQRIVASCPEAVSQVITGPKTREQVTRQSMIRRSS